jgi:hypothetical protein
VDGSSGSCGGAGSLGYLYSDNETPSGTIDGVNTIFGLLHTPQPLGSLYVYRNGLLQQLGGDYAQSGSTIIFYAPSTPMPGDSVTASYRYADPSNPFSAFTSPEIVCSSNGSSTSAATATSLGTCTLPGGLLHTGDRIEIRFQYNHSGTATAFTPSILWGSTSVLSRAASASDTSVAGAISLGIGTSAQPYSVQSWGSALPFAAAVGSAAENSTINLTVTFSGAMAAATSDSVVLSNFTVTRYPALANP